MFTIDLLKGAGKPPRSHPLWAAGATLAFMLLAAAAVLDGTRYLRENNALAAQQRTLAYYREKIRGLQNVADELAAAENRRSEINAALVEVNKALSYHATWSPIIATTAQNTPPEIILTDMMAKREEKGSGAQMKFAYSLILGVMSPSGAAVVEQYVRALRLSLPLAPGPDSIRIISQRQERAGNQMFQYYVVECRLKM